MKRTTRMQSGRRLRGLRIEKFAVLLFVLGQIMVTVGNPSFLEAETNKVQVAQGNAVTHWNEVANQFFPFDPGPILDTRAFAIMHASIHDAVNGVERRYEPYTANLSSPGASVDAAVAAAAHDVLVELSPSNVQKIESSYDEALAAIPDGPAKNDGIRLGRQCAQANLERRANDGIATVAEPVYVPTAKPGDYDFTPPFNRPPLGPAAFFPGLGRLKPFVIDPTEHRVKGPDSLQSESYTKDLNHLKSIGSIHSEMRTEDQTQIAFFWFEGFPIWNQIANSVIRQRNLDAWQAARILALLNIASIDTMIVCFEAKYHFRFWRPFTAIRRAAEDGNPQTEPDEGWRPLLWSAPNVVPPTFFIPPIPEYPSAAANGSAAAAEVLIRFFGDDVEFEATSPTLPDVTRKFKSFSQAAKESRFSRVYGGIHFLKAIRDGFNQGKGVGAAISDKLPPIR